jgi:hypothetical protein
MGLPNGLAGFSLGAVFSAAAIEGGMHILVHYFEPIANFMTHVAGVVVPGLDVAWALVFPVIDAVGIGDLFTTAAGEADFMNEFVSPPGLE